MEEEKGEEDEEGREKEEEGLGEISYRLPVSLVGGGRGTFSWTPILAPP